MMMEDFYLLHVRIGGIIAQTLACRIIVFGQGLVKMDTQLLLELLIRPNVYIIQVKLNVRYL